MYFDVVGQNGGASFVRRWAVTLMIAYVHFFALVSSSGKKIFRTARFEAGSTQRDSPLQEESKNTKNDDGGRRDGAQYVFLAQNVFFTTYPVVQAGGVTRNRESTRGPPGGRHGKLD